MTFVKLLDAFRELGYSIHEDWDGELLIEEPEYIDVGTATAILMVGENQIRHSLSFEQEIKLSRFMGGPLDGKRHEEPSKILKEKERLKGFRIERAKWAVYYFETDGRAIFRGYATSEKKARQGILVAE